jgi:hypothetical protein
MSYPSLPAARAGLAAGASTIAGLAVVTDPAKIQAPCCWIGPWETGRPNDVRHCNVSAEAAVWLVTTPPGSLAQVERIDEILLDLGAAIGATGWTWGVLSFGEVELPGYRLAVPIQIKRPNP